ncbi:MAG TPA: hypothetical protein VFK05_19895 [Polyangiaceae bacterium]|nr:hypothetical protein [Polyangiaceae bacterium]
MTRAAQSRSWLCLLAVATLSTVPFQACASNESEPSEPGSAGSAGAKQSAGASGTENDGRTAGSAGESSHHGGDGGAGAAGAAGSSDAAGAAGMAGAVGSGDEAPGPDELLETGRAIVTQTTRPAYGALLAVSDGDRSYVVESRRDVEAGPFGLPWRSRFRLAAYDHGELAWAYLADADDLIGDVAVHPSGEVTLSLERQLPERNADELVRLDREGQLISKTPLASPSTIPATDYGANDPQPLFAMKSALADATTAGWVRLLPDGEGVVVAFLSFVATPNDAPLSQHLALGLERLDWRSRAYVERWARVVEGSHFAQPAVWTYDEFRWDEQAVRPFLARDESTGDLLVGRAWNQTRCQANVATFAEATKLDCVLRAPSVQENQLLPLAVTRFDAAGARVGTRILWPDTDAAEQVAFALAAQNGELAVAGAVVRTLADGSKKTYPDANGFVDYDGYIAVYDAEGTPLEHHDFDLGRGDVLAGMRFLQRGIVAVGAAGWDRWQGGMSISGGSSPFFAWFSRDGKDARVRSIPLGNGSRHWNLHDLTVQAGKLVGHGFSDAPMTHSADGNKTAERSFGTLRIELE